MWFLLHYHSHTGMSTGWLPVMPWHVTIYRKGPSLGLVVLVGIGLTGNLLPFALSSLHSENHMMAACSFFEILATSTFFLAWCSKGSSHTGVLQPPMVLDYPKSVTLYTPAILAVLELGPTRLFVTSGGPSNHRNDHFYMSFWSLCRVTVLVTSQGMPESCFSSHVVVFSNRLLSGVQRRCQFLRSLLLSKNFYLIKMGQS
jgi:hypothetical protein